MRQEINLLILVVLLYSFPAYADIFTVSPNDCETYVPSGQKVVFSKMINVVSIAGSCDGAKKTYTYNQAQVDRDSVSEWAACTICVAFDINNCPVETAAAWCPDSVTGGPDNAEHTLSSTGTVTGVAAGGEAAAAKAFATAFFEANPYPTISFKIRTDGGKGHSYTSTLSADNVTVDVKVVAWKRGIYTDAGSNPVPLGDLGGGGSGGGSGGLSKSDTQEAVQAGTDAGFTDVKGAVDGLKDANQVGLDGVSDSVDGLKTSNEAGLAQVKGAVSGVSGLLSDIKNMFNDSDAGGLKSPFALNDVSNNPDNVAKGEGLKNTLKSSLDGFTANMKTTGIYTSISGFFGGIPPSSSAPVVQIAGGRLGNHTFDFQSWASLLSVLSTTLKVVFTFIAVRIVAINGV